MNVFKLTLNAITEKHLKIIALSAIAGNEMDTRIEMVQFADDDAPVAHTCLYLELPFSLSNIDISENYLKTLVKSSRHQNVLDNLDLPTVSKGNVVVSVFMPKDRASVVKFYESYAEIFVDAGTSIAIGISSATATQVVTPFENITHVAIDAERYYREQETNIF